MNTHVTCDKPTSCLQLDVSISPCSGTLRLSHFTSYWWYPPLPISSDFVGYVESSTSPSLLTQSCKGEPKKRHFEDAKEMGGRGEKLWPSALSLTYPSPTLPLMFPPPNLCFPCGSAGKESACNVRDLGSIPGLGRSPGEGKGCPLQYSGLENSMDCIVHRVAKSWTRLSHLHNLFSQSEQCFHFPHFAFLLFFLGPHLCLASQILVSHKGWNLCSWSGSLES